METSADTPSQMKQSSVVLPMVVVRILRRAIAVLVPILLVLLSVRLVLSETYLSLIYQRPGFPEDLYGWETDVRLEYGPYGVNYLLNSADISYLGDLVIDGELAFNQRELSHMEDVKVVTRAAMSVLWISLAIFLLSGGLLAWHRETRFDLLMGISLGGFYTIGIAVLLLGLVVFAWDFFFESFHSIFFSDGTWQFFRKDTLIRLYPQQFWIDSSIVVGGITIGGAVLCAFLPRWWIGRKRPPTTPLTPEPSELVDQA